MYVTYINLPIQSVNSGPDDSVDDEALSLSFGGFRVLRAVLRDALGSVCGVFGVFGFVFGVISDGTSSAVDISTFFKNNIQTFFDKLIVLEAIYFLKIMLSVVLCTLRYKLMFFNLFGLKPLPQSLKDDFFALTNLLNIHKWYFTIYMVSKSCFS